MDVKGFPQKKMLVTYSCKFLFEIGSQSIMMNIFSDLGSIKYNLIRVTQFNFHGNLKLQYKNNRYRKIYLTVR